MSTGAPARVAAVTGASSGIGAATAVALGRLGWRVALGARRSERLAEVARRVEAAGGSALAAALDVTEPDSIDAFFAAAEAAFGAADVVVSNAGVCVPGLLHEVGEEDLAIELRTNLLGPALVVRRALPAMLARGSGDLVFVSSQNAVAPRPFQAGYSAAKAGVESLARVLAMELEGTGVRATIVRPGPTASEFGRGWKPETIRRVLAAWKHWGLQRHLRWLPPESVASAVVAAVTAPPGTHLDLLQVMPEGPSPEAS